jgi:NADPH:quinone reductase-like Zn-dependent oxidoreductase
MLHLQPSTSSDWLQFNISSAPPHKDVWTQHASGLVSVRPNRPSMSPRLDTEMDPRGVDVAEWYAAFAEAGIEFGPTFQGLSALQADARTNICSANVALHTTHHLFNGPESEYVAIHPASLDMCNQLSLISLHGGEPDLLRHAYIPISIDEMTIWPQSPSDTNAQCTVVGHKKGLRGGYASVQLSTASGQPLVEIKTLQCISYDGNEKIATQASAHEYMRLAWKPDISHMSSARAGQHLHSLLDLASHQNPEMKVLEIGSDAGGASDTLDYLDSSSTKRYGTFRFAKVSEGLDAASPEASTSEKQLFSKFGLEQGLDSDYDVVIFRFGSEFESLDASEALQAIRKLMKKDGTLILTDATIKDSSVLAVALGSAGFKFSSGQVENYTDSSSSVSTIMATAIEGASAKISPNSGSKVYIVYDQRETSLSAAIASELQARTAGAVLAPLQDCELPERSRIIFVPNPERSILASATEEDFARVKYIVQHASSLLWVTPGDIVGGMNPEAGLVTGLVRMLVTEHPEARFGVLHLDGNSMKDPSKIATAVADLEKELQDGNSEYEHAIREGVVHIPRLVYDNDLNERYRGMHASAPTLDYAPIHSRGPVIADFETPGSVSTLYFKEDTSGGSLPDDYIEIEVAAVGLDQEDWAACTGRTDNADFFSEVTGIVTRCGSATTARFHPGDHVFALAGGRFATMMTLPACLAQRVSPKVPLSDMASMPVAFCSAINALRHVANIRRGEKVLLHATLADAGSALASAQVAQHLGAEVFAAVESEENADRFATLANISRDSVYTVPSATNESQANPLAGKRFNVILNTTPTTTVGDSWRYLSPRGRFISMGKIDVEKATAIAIGVAARNATFSSFDLRSLVVEDRDFGTQ